MLVLTRKESEQIRIGDEIVITVVDTRSDRVRIGIQAPPNVPVHREEIYDRIHGDDIPGVHRNGD